MGVWRERRAFCGRELVDCGAGAVTAPLNCGGQRQTGRISTSHRMPLVIPLLLATASCTRSDIALVAGYLNPFEQSASRIVVQRP